MHSVSRFTLSLLFLLCLYSCSDSVKQLNTAKQLLDTAPDSSLHILRKLKPNHFLFESDKAAYALLYSQVLDRLEIHQESDSLVDIAIKYYDGSDNALKAGYAWFLKSRCAGYRNDANKQASGLLKAQEYALQSGDNKLKGMVYADKADFYKSQQQLDSSITYNKAAYLFFIWANEKSNALICLLKVGNILVIKSKFNYAIAYFQQAEKIAVQLKDPIMFSAVYRTLGTVYSQKKEYDKSLYYYHKVPETSISYYDSNKYLLLADVFFYTNQSDSAIYYLNKINKNKNENSYYSKLWLKIAEKRGDKTQALYYAKRITTINDSLYKLNLDVSFAGLEKKYKYQGLQIANQQLTIRDKQKSIFLLIALIIISLGAIGFLIWKNRVKNRQLIIERKLVEQEKDLLEKEIIANKLLEQQVKMQNIILLNIEQHRKNAIKRPDDIKALELSDTKLLFYDELIACMDLEYNDISKRLAARFQGITERDILICCLLLAGFDTGMIASVLDVRIESINKQRYRLRTRLGLENSENLLEFLRIF